MAEIATKIRSYVSDTGIDKVAQWYISIPAGDRTFAYRAILEAQRTKDWRTLDYKRLARGLGELRWKAGEKQYRLFGFFGEGVWYAVMGCTHKMQVYNPHDAPNQAEKRMGKIRRGEVTTNEFHPRPMGAVAGEGFSV